jgi:hypothetical protein
MKKGIVVKERTFLETMRLGFAKSTDGCFSRVMSAELTNDSFAVLVIFGGS